MAGNSRIRINGNKLVIPHTIRYNYLPHNGATLYIWCRERETNYVVIMDGYEQYAREEGFSRIMPKALARHYKRLFCGNIEATKIEENAIKLPGRVIKHLGTNNIELRTMNILLEIHPKSDYNTPQE
ncbi:hypothetical protein HYU07_06925 [Candidatus Woesearchaeota archaeon]|nr:hypothetical protein [Candidatus Woesearchaeota archaeon]